MKIIVSAALMVAVLGLSGCNTAVGVGKDVWGGTRFVGDTVFGDDEKN